MTSEVILAPIFSDNAILQADKPVNIFGYGRAGSIVNVRLGSETTQTIVDKNGKWQVRFASKPACWRTTLTVRSAEAFIQRDVIFGEVYLFSGQSNIEYKLADDIDFLSVKEHFDHSNIRFYYTPQIEYETQLSFTWGTDDLPRWQLLTKENLGEISAIAYYAVVEIANSKPRVPIGILECFKGGTSASSWISETNLASDSRLKQIYLDAYYREVDGKTESDFSASRQEYEGRLAEYNQKKAEFIRKHPEMTIEEVKMQVGHTPWPPPMEPTSYLRPNGLYHTMFRKIAPYTIKQLIWYQGENDADHFEVYERLLTRLLMEWRRDLQDDFLPIVLVQLPQYQDGPKDTWAGIRQAQWQVVQKLSNVHLASIIDTGEKHNIHPISKSKAGHRLGELMISRFYNATPMIIDYKVVEHTLILISNNTLNLQAQDLVRVEVKIGNKWKKADDVSVGGNRIAVPFTDDTDAVRYAYENAPIPTIFNEVGYPLSPFLIELR